MRIIYSDDVGYGIYPGKIFISNKTEKELESMVNFHKINSPKKGWNIDFKKNILKKDIESFDKEIIDPLPLLYFNITTRNEKSEVDIIYSEKLDNDYETFVIEENILNKPKIHFLENLLYLIADPINSFGIPYDNKLIKNISPEHLSIFYKAFLPEIIENRKNKNFKNNSYELKNMIKCYYRQLYESVKQKDYGSLNNVLARKNNITAKYFQESKTEN